MMPLERSIPAAVLQVLISACSEMDWLVCSLGFHTCTKKEHKLDAQRLLTTCDARGLPLLLPPVPPFETHSAFFGPNVRCRSPQSSCVSVDHFQNKTTAAAQEYGLLRVFGRLGPPAVPARIERFAQLRSP